ncbi:MAG: hypothetical protein QOE90_884 [Thermoplasmata archaeon]|nr:hypothetical protein [Thermoplasmata archaeon]
MRSPLVTLLIVGAALMTASTALAANPVTVRNTNSAIALTCYTHLDLTSAAAFSYDADSFAIARSPDVTTASSSGSAGNCPSTPTPGGCLNSADGNAATTTDVAAANNDYRVSQNTAQINAVRVFQLGGGDGCTPDPIPWGTCTGTYSHDNDDGYCDGVYQDPSGSVKCVGVYTVHRDPNSGEVTESCTGV